MVKNGYKQTDIGVIPEDWDISIIEQHCNIQTGNKNTQDRVYDGMYPFFVRSQTIEKINSYAFDGEAILTAGDGVGTGKVHHYINGKFDFHQRVYCMTNFSNKLDGYFFYLYFKNNFFSRISQMTAKSSVDSVRRDMISNMKIPIPPKEEQKAIALALSDVDGLITSLEKLIAKKESIKTATMQQLLTGKKRLEGFHGEWEQKQLGDIASFSKGKGLPKSQLSLDGKYKCIHYGELFTTYKEIINNIQSFTNHFEDTVLSIENDILMPTSDVTPNGLATASCIQENGIILGGDILIIRPNKNILDGRFFAFYISIDKNQIMQLVSGSTVYHLYGSDMAKFILNTPPTIEEQQAIAQILSDMDNEIEALKTKLSKTKAIKDGMMSELLSGKTRLKGVNDE